MSVGVSWSTNVSSATASVSTTAQIGYIRSIDGVGGITTSNYSSSGTTSFSSTSTNQNSFSSSYSMSNIYSAMSGVRPYHVPLAGNILSPGEYWGGMIFSTNTGSGTYSLQRVCQPASWGPVCFTTLNQSYLVIGSSAAITTTNYRHGFGSYSASSNTTAATGFALSQISTISSQLSHYFAIVGQPLI